MISELLLSEEKFRKSQFLNVRFTDDSFVALPSRLLHRIDIFFLNELLHPVVFDPADIFQAIITIDFRTVLPFL